MLKIKNMTKKTPFEYWDLAFLSKNFFTQDHIKSVQIKNYTKNNTEEEVEILILSSANPTQNMIIKGKDKEIHEVMQFIKTISNKESIFYH